MFEIFLDGALAFGVLFVSSFLVDFVVLRKATGCKAAVIFLIELAVFYLHR